MRSRSSVKLAHSLIVEDMTLGLRKCHMKDSVGHLLH